MCFGVLSISGVVLAITIPLALAATRAPRDFGRRVSDKEKEIGHSPERHSTGPEPISIRSRLPANVIIPKLLL
jgi:hypothetical protein